MYYKRHVSVDWYPFIELDFIRGVLTKVTQYVINLSFMVLMNSLSRNTYKLKGSCT